MAEFVLRPDLAAFVALIAALALACVFRRNRAVLILATLILAGAGLAAPAWPALAEFDPRTSQGAFAFAPWLISLAVFGPEPALWSRRTALFLLLLLFGATLSLGAPDHVWSAVASWLPVPSRFAATATAAAVLIALAALASVLRWVFGGKPIDLGMGLVLGLVAIAFLLWPRRESAMLALACAGGLAALTVLYASYRMAFIDALTGLPNRRALDETLARVDGPCAVAMVDVDHFKQFNDRHGHEAGDRVLRAVAARLRRTRGGHAFRYGGEEFCLLFTGAKSRDAAAHCEDARSRLEALAVRIRSQPGKARRTQTPKKTEQTDVHVTVSIGVAARATRRGDTLELLRAADQALYRAKAKGRNRVIAV